MMFVQFEIVCKITPLSKKYCIGGEKYVVLIRKKKVQFFDYTMIMIRKQNC